MDNSNKSSEKIWLLSWNQKKWNWDNYEEWCEQTKIGKVFYDNWRCSNSHAKKGDEFFIAKCGTGIKGVFAHGFLTTDSYIDNDNVRGVGIELDYIINYKKEKILELDVLKKECPEQDWSPQSSGIEIKEKYFEKLKILWNKLIGSLKTMNEQENEKTISLMNLLEVNKNLILHGAPGTGKTYTAKDIAAQMICGKTFSQIESGSEEEKLFNEQTEFVQFHPSYDYSDFVEGLRPIEGENTGDVGFERKDGVFKEFCERALKNQLNNNKTSEVLSKEFSFQQAFESLVSQFQDGTITEIELQSGTIMDIESFNSDNSVFYLKTHNSIAKPYAVSLNRLMKLSNTFNSKKEVENIKNIDREIRSIIGGCHSSAYWGVLNKIFEIKEQAEQNIVIQKEYLKKYIFIIDEINRGEMSKIFGELFFSIDPDYRGSKGKVRTQYANMLAEQNDFDDALGITSSYGHFFVPENVYIIGTMNDIDRSVDSMDFAMRRRFTFVELKANECLGMLNNLELSEGITKSDIVSKMVALNEEIEKISGLSSAYHIGGSYFAKLSKYSEKTKSEAFECLWNNHLEPLITDYLRGLPNIKAKLAIVKTKYDAAGIESEESDN